MFKLNTLDIDLYNFYKGLLLSEKRYHLQVGSLIENESRLLAQEIRDIQEHYFYKEVLSDSFLKRHFNIDYIPDQRKVIRAC